MGGFILINMKYIYTLLTVTALCLTACENKPTTGQSGSTETTKEQQARVPDFSADSAFRYVAEQVAFGPRVPNTKAHAACADYLVKELERSNGKVFVQKAGVKAFDGKTLNIQNIIAAFYPEKTKRIMLCAHWDTRPFADQDTRDQDKPIDGANDGGSGVAVLLEVARQLSIQEPEVGIDIIFFDAEDYGQPEDSEYPEMKDSYCLGSQYWAKNPPVPNYRPFFGILLDMVGGYHATYAQDEVSRVFAPAFVNKIWDAGVKAGYSSYFIFKQTPPIIDDHYYINTLASIPTVDIIHHDESSPSGFWTHWHTHEDKLENIDPQSLKAVGQTLLTLIYQEKAN